MNVNWRPGTPYFIQDKNLSLKGKGFLSQMLDSPSEDQNYALEELAAMNRDGVTAIRSVLSELEGKGYLKRTQELDASGKTTDVYTVYGQPQL